MTTSSKPNLKGILFPGGTGFEKSNAGSTLLAQYKLFMETSERLVERRQKMNAFFLSVNAVLVSAMGLATKDTLDIELAVIVVVSISMSGVVMCVTWKKLVRSYAQLNTGKFAVIHLMEAHLPAALFQAEWAALGEGKDPAKYSSFTRTERIVPIAFMALYALASLAVLLWFFVLRE